MGAAIIAYIHASMASTSYQHSQPESTGQRLDRELRERDEHHRKEIRDLEQKVEQFKRNQIFGI